MNDTNDRLREIWNHGQSDKTEFGAETLHSKGAMSSIGKIRRNMRMEFYAVLFSFLAAGIVLYYYPPPPATAAIVWMLLALLIAGTAYFVTKVMRFYNRSLGMEFNTRESLTWFKYEVRLLLEMYRSYAVTSMFGGFFSGLLHGVIQKKAEIQEPGNPAILFSTALFLILFFYILMEVWLYWFYGRHVRKIERILADLGS